LPSKKAVSVKPKAKGKLGAQASLKEKAVTGLIAIALTATMVIPEVAKAAELRLSPSLN
jgi:hypothetical protein